MTDCFRTSVGIAPLDEVSAGDYLGVPRGLYLDAAGAGSNERGAAHVEVGHHVGESIVPRAVDGAPDAGAGHVGVCTIGFSDGALISTALFDQLAAGAEPHLNPTLRLVNGCVAGRDSFDLSSASNPYWTTELPAKLAAAGVDRRQVQVAFLFSGKQQPPMVFPTDADEVQAELAGVVRNALAFFPHLKQLFMTCVSYGGYRGATGEPHDFQQAFAFRGLIAQQATDPGLLCDDRRGTPVAPWLDWGFYPWCDGTTPRLSDGLTWVCTGNRTTSDVAPSDGHHPTPSHGAPKLAAGWLEMLRAHPVARRWWLAAPAAGEIPPPPGPTGQLGG